MNHEQAALLIPDFVGSRLDRQQAADVERHFAECDECRGSLALHRRLRSEIESAGAPLFSEHPSSDDLVDFALAPARSLDARLLPLGAHVRACPTCQVEVASIRGAEAESGAASAAWRAGLAGALARLAPPGPIPALVPALLLLVFVYPAYLGLVQLPGIRREHAKTLEELAALRENPPGGDSWLGGPAATLALPAESRGGDTVSIPPPTVRLRAGQAFVPARIDFDPSAWPAQTPVVVTLRAAGSQETLWSIRSAAGDLWDAADEAINLLLPARKLAPGEYVVEIRGPESTTPDYSGRFRIEG